MLFNPQKRSRDRCEMYVGVLLLLVSGAILIPPVFSLVGSPLAISLSIALMSAGMEGLLYFSLLLFCMLPVLY